MAFTAKISYEEVVTKAEAHARATMPTTAEPGKEGTLYKAFIAARVEAYIAGVAEALDNRMLILEHRLAQIRAKQEGVSNDK